MREAVGGCFERGIVAVSPIAEVAVAAVVNVVVVADIV